MTYIIAYRFTDGLRYWSQVYGWTPNIDEATEYGTKDEADSYAYASGAFVLGLENGEIIDV